MTETQEVQAQPTEAVIRKIQLLLNMANRASGNEAEAAAAMATAQKLLAKYNLDYHQVQQAQVAGGTNAVEEKREKQLVAFSAMYRWQRELWAAIAEANFCWHWVTEVRGPHLRRVGRTVYAKRHMLVGRESNVIAVRLMGEYLCKTLERILPYPNSERLSRSAISWREGCATRLAERITEQARQSRTVQAGATEQQASTALAMRSITEREEEANYDTRYGAGAWQRAKAYEAGRAERDAARAAEQEKRQAQEEKEWLEYLQTETPAQKVVREKQEERDRIAAARRWQAQAYRDAKRWAAEDRKEASRLDWRAYNAGTSAGDGISLNRQAGSGAATKALSD